MNYGLLILIYYRQFLKRLINVIFLNKSLTHLLIFECIYKRLFKFLARVLYYCDHPLVKIP